MLPVKMSFLFEDTQNAVYRGETLDKKIEQ